jgi:hypothetical protein
MKDATKRSIFRWLHLVFAIPIVGYIYSRLTKFQTIPPLLGLSSSQYLSFGDCGCGKAMSFDDLFGDRRVPQVRARMCDVR